VVLPGMPITLAADVGTDEKVLLVPRHDNKYSTVGVVAEVSERVRLGGHRQAVSLMALHRAKAGSAEAGPDGVLRVEVEARPDQPPAGSLTHELERGNFLNQWFYRRVVCDFFVHDIAQKTLEGLKKNLEG